MHMFVTVMQYIVWESICIYFMYCRYIWLPIVCVQDWFHQCILYKCSFTQWIVDFWISICLRWADISQIPHKTTFGSSNTDTDTDVNILFFIWVVLIFDYIDNFCCFRKRAAKVRKQDQAPNDCDWEYYFPTSTSPLLFNIKDSWIMPNKLVLNSLIGKGKKSLFKLDFKHLHLNIH